MDGYEVCPFCHAKEKRVVLFQRIGNVAVIRPQHGNCTSYLITGPFTVECGRCQRPMAVLAGGVLEACLTGARRGDTLVLGV